MSRARDLEADLRRDLDGEVAFDDYSRHLFSRDASMYAITPLGVAFPRHSDDVAAAVSACAALDVPVVPRGAGTSLAGQTVGPGLVLDMSRHLHRVHAVDPEARTALVDVGVVQDQLNAAAAPYGLMFGPDTATSNRATIGGMVGNNSAGSGSVRFGMTIDHVRHLDVVLSDGGLARLEPVDEAERSRRAVRKTLEGRLYAGLPELLARHERSVREDYPAFWRRAGGYRLDRLADPSTPFDLATFVVGAEGTLVVATKALVDLVPRPRRTVFAVGHFTSVAAAIAATGDALSCDPAQVELMDKTILDLSRERIEYADLGRSLDGDPAALLFVSFTGDDDKALVADLDRLGALWRKHEHGYHTLRAVTAAQQSALLKVRRSSLGLLMAASVGTRRPLAFVEDTAVPPEHLATYTERFRAVLDRHGMQAGFYGHASVGCLHVRPFVDVTDPAQVAAMRAVATEVKDLVAEYGGANSSEHGDGLVRSEFNRSVFGDDLYQAMREVKALFDPENVMNPGKIVDSPAMTEHLRDPALPPARPLRTHLTFDVVGGMRGAADRCMNIGLCRKTTSGVMCPSYVATLQEEHSTRGRANALVKALSEPDPAAALGSDERLHEILDLCLMCKACKSECPLGVDMATLKSETLAHHHEAHGTPLRSRAFGSIRLLNRLGSATAPLSNLPGRSGPLRAVMGRWLGIALLGVLVAGVERGIRRGAIAHAAVPVHPVVRLIDRLDLVLPADGAVAVDPALRAEGGVRPIELERALVAREARHVARAVAEVRRVADHQPLGIVPEGLHLVRRGEAVLVGPRVDAAQAHAGLRDTEIRDVVNQVEEVYAPLRNRALRELPVPVPRRVHDRVERLVRPAVGEGLPIEIGRPDVPLQILVPVRLLAVPDLFDPGELPELSRLQQFPAALRDWCAPQLRADLDDRARGFRGVVRAVQFVEPVRHRLLDVHVLASLRGRFEVRGVPVIG